MNTKSRFMFTAVVMSLLLAMLAPTAFAGEEFNLLTGNNDFDTTNEHGFVFLDPWWTLTNKTGDKIDCSGETVTAFTGDCSFRFRGSANENSILKQVVTGSDLDVVNAFADDAPVSIYLTYKVNSLTANANLKGRVVVKIAGQPKLKATAHHNGSTMIGEFTNWSTVSGASIAVPQDAVINSIVVKLNNKTTKGKVFVDNVRVMFSSQAMK